MHMQSEPNQVKESQRKSWDSVSKGWQTWWKTVENGAYNISNRLVELANVKPGDRVDRYAKSDLFRSCPDSDSLNGSLSVVD